jgi:hypothetical protein
MFIHKVKSQAGICSWIPSILTIPSAKCGGQPLSLLTHYGQLSYTDIESHSRIYRGQDIRVYQDSSNFKFFLDRSLSQAIMMHVLAQSHKYTFGGEENGPAIIRVILGIVSIATKATIAVINASLRSLPAKLIELKNNITTFNEYVTNQSLELTSRGHEPADLLYILFDTYKTAINKDFREYIMAKQNAIFDDSMDEITPQQSMIMAEDKYKIMIMIKEWDAKETKSTTTDEHIVALRAAVKALTVTANAKPNGSSGTTPKKTNKAPAPNSGIWAWKDVVPKKNESKFKTFKSKEYVYCPNHASNKWVLASKHKNECTLDDKWRYPTGKDEKPADKAESAKDANYVKTLLKIVRNNHGDDDDENI